jgi:hypothetical protein
LSISTIFRSWKNASKLNKETKLKIEGRYVYNVSHFAIFLFAYLNTHQTMMYAQNQATPNPLDADLAVICTPFPYVVPYCFSSVGEEKN